MLPLSRPLENKANHGINAVQALDALVRRHGPDGVPRERLLELIADLSIKEEEKVAMRSMLDRVTADDRGAITAEQWVIFVHDYQEDILHAGLIESLWVKMVATLDLFKAGAWNEFDYYEQASLLGGFAGVVVLLVMALTIAMFMVAFWNGNNTVVEQRIASNSQAVEQMGDFFLFFRSSSFENILDDSLFSFDMSHFIKSTDPVTGKITEQYVPIPIKQARRHEIDYWPKGIPDDIRAVRPDADVMLAGAYHSDFFRQVEVKLRPCRNSTATGAPVCRPASEVRALLYGGTVNLVREKAVRGTFHDNARYWILMEGQTKQVDLWLSHSNLVNSSRFLFDEPQVETRTRIFESSEQVGPLWDDGTLLVWWFSHGPYDQEEVHHQESVVQVLANCGGAWSGLLGLFGMVAATYNRHLLSNKVTHLRMRKRYTEDIRIVCTAGAACNLHTSLALSNV